MTIHNVSSKPMPSTPAAPERTPGAAPRPSPGAAGPSPDALKKDSPKVQAPSAPAVEEVARRLESYMKSVSRSLEFRVDADTGRTVVSVRDAESGELIRQIPSDEVLRLAQMAEDQTIVLLDEKV